jgi:hypothetical protein
VVLRHEATRVSLTGWPRVPPRAGVGPLHQRTGVKVVLRMNDSPSAWTVSAENGG